MITIIKRVKPIIDKNAGGMDSAQAEQNAMKTNKKTKQLQGGRAVVGPKAKLLKRVSIKKKKKKLY